MGVGVGVGVGVGGRTKEVGLCVWEGGSGWGWKSVTLVACRLLLVVARFVATNGERRTTNDVRRGSWTMDNSQRELVPYNGLHSTGNEVPARITASRGDSSERFTVTE